jgi:hypothetical protein
MPASAAVLTASEANPNAFDARRLAAAVTLTGIRNPQRLLDFCRIVYFAIFYNRVDFLDIDNINA